MAADTHRTIGRVEAKRLDTMLNDFQGVGVITELSEDEFTLCQTLIRLGYVDVVNKRRRYVRLTDDGLRFIQLGGFEKMGQVKHDSRTKTFLAVATIVATLASSALALSVVRSCSNSRDTHPACNLQVDESRPAQDGYDCKDVS